MSAFQVSSRHIAALADELCKLLAEENARSINSRYHTPEKPTLAVSDFAPFNRNVIRDYTPFVLLKAIACYEYQSCEHSTWYESKAHEICQRLRRDLITQLAGWEQTDGWGIE